MLFCGHARIDKAAVLLSFIFGFERVCHNGPAGRKNNTINVYCVRRHIYIWRRGKATENRIVLFILGMRF